MMALTHGAIALAGASLFLGSSQPLVLVLAVIGSQIPDIDTTTSIAGRVVYPIASWIEARYPHRTITHSLLATLVLTVSCLPLVKYFDVRTAIALPLGHLLACFSDTCTKEGVGLFYPSPVRAVYGSNPNNRLSTGSTVEYWVLCFFVALLVLTVNLNSNGGLLMQFNQVVGLKSGVVQVYNRYGNNRHIYVKVRGVKTSDRQPINNNFFLVASDGSEVILQNAQGIYKTEENIIVKRAIATPGDQSLTVSTQSIFFDDEDVVSRLRQFTNTSNNSSIYLSGTIEIDEPEYIRYVDEPGQLQTITVSTNTVTLRYCPIERAIAVLNDQWAIGSLNARIITPSPVLE